MRKKVYTSFYSVLLYIGAMAVYFLIFFWFRRKTAEYSGSLFKLPNNDLFFFFIGKVIISVLLYVGFTKDGVWNDISDI